MKNCTTCTNAIFDRVWCEYKCGVLKHRIYDLDFEDCEHYKKGEPKMSKEVKKDGEC